MSYSSYSSSPFGFVLTRWVRLILIANASVFVAITLLGWLAGWPLAEYLAFRPVDALWRPWTVVTYMFAHEGFWHLFFNMLGLFFFGPVLEDRWGSGAFIKFYLLCGLGGAVLSGIFPHSPIIGASAAVYGVMVAFAVYWPDSPIYIWGVFPVKAKWLVAFLVGMSLYSAVSGSRSGVAHLAHLGGAFTSFAYLKSPWAPAAWGEVYRTPGRARRPRGWRDALRRFRRRPRAEPSAPRPPQQTRPLEIGRQPDDVDRILDKISEAGIGSLTADERRRLEEASRKLGTN